MEQIFSKVCCYFEKLGNKQTAKDYYSNLSMTNSRRVSPWNHDQKDTSE